MIKIQFSNIYIDIKSEAMDIIFKHRQRDNSQNEHGGLLIGYENKDTGNITITNCIVATKSKIKSSPVFLSFNTKQLLSNIGPDEPDGYIGTWHTHGEIYPHYSYQDLNEWNKCQKHNKDATQYLVHIIAGLKYANIWIKNDLPPVLIGSFKYECIFKDKDEILMQ